MRLSLRFVVAIAGVICVAVACGGHSSGPPPVSSTQESAVAGTSLTRSTRYIYVAVSTDGKSIVTKSYQRLTESLTPMRSTPTPSPSPAATPTPYCPFGTDNQTDCFFIPPGGDSVAEVLYCSNCTASNNPVTMNYSGGNQTYPPPPGLTAMGNSSTNQTPVDCSQSCSLTTCWQTYPTCWVQIVWTAAQSAQPANAVTNMCLLWVGGAGCINYTDFITIAPTVMDLNIVGSQTAQTVSVVNPGATSTPSPIPTIMVGQQVQVEASPSGTLTNVQWHFDSVATSDVVGDYALKDSVGSPPTAIAPVPTPSPVPSSGNPISFYWIAGGQKHFYVTASAPNVQGALVADVYYNVSTPAPSVTALPNSVELPNDYPVVVNNSYNCPGTHLAISLGTPCQPVGISWTYTASIPAFGAGSLAMLQITNLAASGTANGQQFSQSASGLDGTFPYASLVSTSSSWQSNDSPGYYLSSTTPSPCSAITYAPSFTDYFMYQPGVTSTRQGSRLWVTTGTMTWKFSGTASGGTSGYSLSSHKTINPAPSFTNSNALPTWTSVLNPFSSNC